MKIHRYTLFVLFSTFILIVAGGLVTSTGSGLSVPDWPLSYGSFFPPMVGGIRFEHTHRLIAGFVGLLTLGLAIAVCLGEKRRWLKGLALAAFGMVVLQALLGGLTVLMLLPPPVSIFHACLGQIFFSTLAALAYVTSAEWSSSIKTPSRRAERIQHLLLVMIAFALAQLLLGAIVRHTHGRVLYHAVLASLIVMHALFIFIRTMREDGVRVLLGPHAMFLMGLVLLQAGLGIGTWMTRSIWSASPVPRVGEVLLRTAHQACGAVVLASILLLTLRSYRLLSPSQK